jgi:hypothetical protein
VLADRRGVIVSLESGLIVERQGARPIQVRRFGDDGWYRAATRMAASSDWLYVVASHAPDVDTILALPRRDEQVELVFSPEDEVALLRAGGGALYWTEARGSEQDGSPSSFAILRGDPETGTIREVGSADGWAYELALGGDTIYVAGGHTIHRVPTAGGAFETFHSFDEATSTYPSVAALTAHGDRVYWVADSGLHAKKRGAPAADAAVKIADNASEQINSDRGADLVFLGEDTYSTVFPTDNGYAGVVRIRKGGDVETVWSAGEDIVVGKDLIDIDGALYFRAWDSDPHADTLAHTVYRLPLDGAATATALYRAPADSAIDDLVSGGGVLYALLRHPDSRVEIIRLDPATGGSQPVLRWTDASNLTDDGTRLDADASGLYVYLTEHDAILRIGHDATAVR